MDRKHFLTHFENVCAFLTSFELFVRRRLCEDVFLMTKVNLDINSYLFFLFRFFPDEMEWKRKGENAMATFHFYSVVGFFWIDSAFFLFGDHIIN